MLLELLLCVEELLGADRAVILPLKIVLPFSSTDLRPPHLSVNFLLTRNVAVLAEAIHIRAIFGESVFDAL